MKAVGAWSKQLRDVNVSHKACEDTAGDQEEEPQCSSNGAAAGMLLSALWEL